MTYLWDNYIQYVQFRSNEESKRADIFCWKALKGQERHRNRSWSRLRSRHGAFNAARWVQLLLYVLCTETDQLAVNILRHAKAVCMVVGLTDVPEISSTSRELREWYINVCSRYLNASVTSDDDCGS